jgi:protoporphyrinogen oxidase
MSILIIGAGPTGLGAAHRLLERGHTDFLVVDRNDYFGGLAASFTDPRGFTWDFAVHAAHSHYTYFDNLLESLLPDGFHHHERRSWVYTRERFIPYPFQSNFRHLPEEAVADCIRGLRNRPARPEDPPSNFREWIVGLFGEGIADHFMVPYNRKVWCVDPEEMGCQWTGDRVPVAGLDRILEHIEQKKDDVSWGPNATFRFPKEGGTGAIWKKLGERLPPEQVKLSSTVDALDPGGKVASFRDGSTFRYEQVISTIPLPELCRFLGGGGEWGPVKRLKHTRVQVVGVAPGFPLPARLQGKTWIYCPDDNANYYRVTPFSLLSPSHVPDPDRQCSLLCEVSAAGRKSQPDEKDLIRTTLSSLRHSGLIDVDPEHSHTIVMTAEYGYPVPTTDRDEILNEILPRLEEIGIYSRGRFGGWKYEVSNMDHALMQGVEAVDHILDGAEQVTIYQPNLVNQNVSDFRRPPR